jgi:hypothetical protein
LPVVLHRLSAFVLAIACGIAAAAVPPLPDPATLRPGQFIWRPQIAPEGPVVVVIGLDEQRAWVYRNGIAIGVSTISSGREGYRTPTGVFTILQKAREHRSNLYDDAPMPFMQRLTWDGIALHAGTTPGHPASHGCVRLPRGFAEDLYEVTTRGMTVVVADRESFPHGVAYPAVLAPVTTTGGMIAAAALADGYHWDDAAPAEGPLSVLVSLRDRSVHVLRNGIVIGSAELAVAPDFRFGGSQLFVMGEGVESAPSPLDPQQPRHRWTAYTLARSGDAELPAPEQLAAHLSVPQAFARKLYAALAPGTTLLVTDLPAVRDPGEAQPRTVLEAGDGTAKLRP